MAYFKKKNINVQNQIYHSSHIQKLRCFVLFLTKSHYIVRKYLDIFTNILVKYLDIT